LLKIRKAAGPHWPDQAAIAQVELTGALQVQRHDWKGHQYPLVIYAVSGGMVLVNIDLFYEENPL